MTRLLFSYYGDDFTGSTDAMEVLEWGGVRTVLFFEPPTPALLRERFPDVQAVGVAGVSRSMSPAQMDAALPPAFQALKALDTPLVHYKVCSTFDSSPTVGSIGHALDLAVGVFGEQLVPVVVGAPHLRRYVAFSNLFARVGDITYRLDRHPTMSKHPSTPMNEADLRLHLGAQTKRTIGAIDLLHLAQPAAAVSAMLDALRSAGTQVVVFDTLESSHLLTIGGVLAQMIASAAGAYPCFAVGSSGVEKAMVLHWQASGIVREPTAPPRVDAVEQLVVVSGSASPESATQIEWAAANGFTALRLDAGRLVDPAAADAERARIIEAALSVLAGRHSLVLYSVKGPDDPALGTTRTRLAELGLDPRTVGSILGKQQGLILKHLLERTGIRRAVVAGGDTCGYAVQQLGIYALNAAAPIETGAPLCRAHTSAFDGLHIALKGGQTGQPNYFERVRCP